MTALDPLAIELTGTRLIEASAGTGKTHTIATLFVRLVLERRLEVDQILVVTFTNAATAELRDRIRRRLREAAIAFARGASKDPLLAALLSRSRDPGADQQRLARALSGVDEAGILTIHGFCQRILAEYAFDGGVRPDVELIADIQPVVTDLIHDFWNSRFEKARRLEVEYARAHGLGAEDLVALGMLAARFPDAPVVAATGPIDVPGDFERYRAIRERMRVEWAASQNVVLDLLLCSEALKRVEYKESICRRAVAAMRATLDAPEDSLDGWSADVVKLSESAIVAGTRKGKIAPTHAAFRIGKELVDARATLEATLERWAQGMQQEVIRHVRAELPGRLRALSAQSFDDVLHALRDALRGPRRRALGAAIRRRFPAALIDEFHDTDPVQYEIFRTLYRAKKTSLFLIGDPKQAIYAFRGADVFAYLGAAKDADSRSTLDTNYRSDPTLVRAVNTVFASNPCPFLLDAIRFEPVRTPRDAGDRLRLLGSNGSQLQLLLTLRDTKENGRLRAPKPERVPALVAAEIARLLSKATDSSLNDPEESGGARPLRPGDFAVLTRSNVEAHDVQAALRTLGVPSVLHGDTSVLDTTEARELALVLEGLAEPTNATAVRSALATSLLGLDATELFRLGDDEDGWETWLGDFASWHRAWSERGFLIALRRLMRERHVAARILRTVGGERKLTNFLHLTELCHREATARHRGIAGLLTWFADVRHDDEARDGMAAESQQIRLESDERAVQLTTMHRSKGLEYPVVVLPSLWRSSGLFPREMKRLRYHDPTRSNELVLDVRAEDDKTEALAHARDEALAEGLRLAYVALTRAKHRTIVVWGPYQYWQESALARLLHPQLLGGSGATPDDDTIVRDLEALSRASDGAICVERASEAPAEPYRLEGEAHPELHARAVRRRLSTTFRTSSFSALTSNGEASAPEDQREPDPETGDTAAGGPLPGDAAAETAVLLHDFPKGPRAGDTLHAILEEADFERRDPEELPRLVATHLGRGGFDVKRFADVVTLALDDALATRLTRREPELVLGRVATERRLSELEFTFPTANVADAAVTASTVAAVLRRREGKGLPMGYADRVGALEFTPLAGFLRGFIDLVFEHEGRFYLVDYKSNYLGPLPSNYAPAALLTPMGHHHYFLQYHLYLVALHRHLATRVPAYDYDRHMGGALYLFLRGLSKARGPDTGVFFDLPPRDIVEQLSSALSGGPPGGRA